MASIKCRFVPLSKASIRFFLSRLLARWSDLPHPPRVGHSTQPTIRPAIWPPNLASTPTDCPIINGKREVLLFFLRRPGCFRLHSAGPAGTSRTWAWPSAVKVEVGWRPRSGRRSLAPGGTRGLEFQHFRMCVGPRHPSHPPKLTERRFSDYSQVIASRSGKFPDGDSGPELLLSGSSCARNHGLLQLLPQSTVWGSLAADLEIRDRIVVV